MAGRAFLDTKVLVCMFDGRDRAKQERARAAFDGMVPDGIVLSTQVLQEFYRSVTERLRPGMEPAIAAEVVGDLSSHRVVVLDVPVILRAIGRIEEGGITFRDALIVEAALAGGCTRLLTEDMQDGREYDGMRVENPFRP